MRYEIRRSGVTMCASSIPACGYSRETLRSMLESGYRYYIDGKPARRSEI